MKDYRESLSGKRRFSNPEIYKKTLEFQEYLRGKGIAWHNFYSNECTIDFDCCQDKSIGKIPISLSIPSEDIILKTFSGELFEEIKHGDQEHVDWLKNKIEEFTKNYNKNE